MHFLVLQPSEDPAHWKKLNLHSKNNYWDGPQNSSFCVAISRLLQLPVYKMYLMFQRRKILFENVHTGTKIQPNSAIPEAYGDRLSIYSTVIA